MACLCEMYFRYTDQDWDYTGQEGKSTPFSLLDSVMLLSTGMGQNKPCTKLHPF